MAKVQASPELVRVGEDGRGRSRYSTREMVATERRLQATALVLSRRTTHAVVAGRRRAALADTALGADQQLAVAHVTRARDLAVVVGVAGSGKSTMLGMARQAWEAEGYTVRGAALSGIAAEGLEAGSGIASRTIASWEHAWAQGFEQLGPRDVLVVDEAGMIGSRQMERVLAAVCDAGAKVVLVGDQEQLQAIEAGAAFRAIAERVGAVAINEVRRQRETWQRTATQELARGDTAAALDRYRTAGMIQAHATDDAARSALIAGWQAARAQGESQIILAHTRDDVRALNAEARELRRAAGELGEDVVLPTELGPRSFAVGDRIYFLRNERGLGGPGGTGVKNGSLGTIAAIDGDGEAARLTVRLDREDRASGEATVVGFGLAEYAHIDHGYAATVHKAQSVTVDRAHVLATPGMDRHLAYVALTRHRQSVALHWSEESFRSPEGLASRLSRERAKDTTLDYGESEAELCAAYAERRGLQSPDGYGEEAIRILEEMPPSRPRSRDHIVAIDPEDPKPKAPSPARPFDGLHLGVGPLSRPTPAPLTASLTDAVIEFLVASRDGQKMVAAGLPLLAHQEAALRAAWEKIEALRPGFADDLVVASERQPTLVAQAEPSAEGVAPLVAAGERIRDAREETACRHAEYQALTPIRDRLLKERMETWWRKTYPHNPPWDRSAVLHERARPVEEALKREIEAMPAAELRRVEAAWTTADLTRKPAVAPSPAARRSGPSPF